METIVREEILRRLDHMPKDRQRVALNMIRSLDNEPRRGTPGRDLLDLAGSLTPEEAEQMARAIEDEFEQIDPHAW